MDHSALLPGNPRSGEQQYRDILERLDLWRRDPGRLRSRRRLNLGGRLEYIGSTGGNSLLYGPGSGAFSATITPTFQWQYYFARAEFSYVKANGVTSGFGLGPNFNGNSQTRVMVETGILF